LTIFHYHLQPGGVTGVIAAAGPIALSSLGGVTRLRLVTGRRENADAVTENLREASFGKVPVELLVYPELDYLSDIPEGRRSGLSERIEAILGELSDPDDLWWVHNHHIGKNPPFTDALLRSARRLPHQRIVLQIHDFPESGRYQNLALVNRHVTEPLYPILKNLRYVVLNRRDYGVLRAAGIPEDMLFALPNPVKIGAPAKAEGAQPDPGEIRRELAAVPGKTSRRFSEGGRLAIYPVRCIRRKNVLEAAVLTELAGRGTTPWNLVVTLPGTSDQERRYSQMVEDAFDAGLVAGRFSPGTKSDIPFRSIMAGADAIVSSSVQEGFGYTYLEAVASRRPLVARYIDVLSGVDEILRQFAVSFYYRVLVPFSTPSLSDMRPLLRLRYDERLEGVRPLLPPEIFAALSAEADTLLSGDTIDFSFLLPQMQYTVLKDLENYSFAGELVRINTDALAGFRRAADVVADVVADAAGAAAGSGPPEDLSPLEAEFGYSVYGERIKKIVGSFEDGRGRRNQAADADSVLSHFATIDYLRLLYEAI
jgi:glycosyltransferase involved in cell wall biosynthesis